MEHCNFQNKRTATFDPKAAPVVRLEGINKYFGNVHANKDITLDIRPGRIKALLGENGAGKSTLMSILAGRYQPDSGSIIIDGSPVPLRQPKDAIASGIGMVYQHFRLVDSMTVAQNVLLGQVPGMRWRPRAMEAEVSRLAERYGLPIDPAAKISSLSMGERQRVEILKLLYRDSRVLIFDEPTAVLTPTETAQLFDAMQAMADQGKALVFISHKLAEVMAISDEIAILRSGEIVDEFLGSEVPSKEALASRMVGRDVLLSVDREPMEKSEPVLELEGFGGNGLSDLSLTLRKGEIVAIAGVAGNGQKELVEVVCGMAPPAEGEVRVLGSPWHDFYPSPPRNNAMAYIPEERLDLATCANLDLVHNTLLTTRHSFTKGPFLDWDKAASLTGELIEKFNVQPPLPDRLARQLSGGNLQKLVIAREFFRKPKVIVAEQPTQGLDIAATEEVWNRLLEARAEAGVLLVTGDLNEALQLADRVAVMFRGRFMDVFSTDDKEKVDRIGLLMAGITEGDAPAAVCVD